MVNNQLPINHLRALVRLRGILSLESCILCLESCFLYRCRGSITFVENPLQISSFMQNKPNFGKAQMNVNKVLTKDYENKTLGGRGKNKPNSNPIKPNSNPISERPK